MAQLWESFGIPTLAYGRIPGGSWCKSHWGSLCNQWLMKVQCWTTFDAWTWFEAYLFVQTFCLCSVHFGILLHRATFFFQKYNVSLHIKMVLLQSAFLPIITCYYNSHYYIVFTCSYFVTTMTIITYYYKFHYYSLLLIITHH